MKGLQYFLMRIAGNKRYSARTVVSKRYDKEAFIDKMLARNPDLKRENVHLVLNEAFATAGAVVKEGSALVIPGVLKVAPVIKGSFDGPQDRFKKKRNSIHIVCTISSKINRFFGQAVKAQKISPPSRKAEVTMLVNSSGEEAELTLNRSNSVLGIDLKRPGYLFEGIIIREAKDDSEEIRVDLNHLELVEHKDKKLTFLFLRSYRPPAWLEEGKAIHLQLVYKKESSGIPMYSDPFNTRWRGE